MDKIVYKGKEYELFQIDFHTFSMLQKAPYDIENSGNRLPSAELPGHPTYNHDYGRYDYRALSFDGKFFGFKLITNGEEGCSTENKKGL